MFHQMSHTHTSYTTPTSEVYIISTFEILHLKCCIIFKTETWDILQKQSKKRPSCQCSVATVQVMCACQSACGMVSLSVLDV